MLDDRATDYGEAWLIPYNTRRFIEEGNSRYALLPSAILVPKDSRHRAHVPPSAFTIPDYLDILRRGERSWPK